MPKKRHRPEEIVAKLRQVDTIESTVRHLGTDVDDALAIAEQVEI